MPAYDSVRFSPPAPIALVELHSLDGKHEVTQVPMLLDNGADVSLVPKRALAGLNPPVDTFKLEGFDGTASTASAVALEMRFSQRSFRGQYLVVDQEYGILGRNILNLLRIVYDGPREEWDISRASG